MRLQVRNQNKLQLQGGNYQMRTIQINYDAVNAETTKLRRQQTDLVDQVNTQYRQIQSELRQVDGAANAQLIEAMEVNCQKAIAASKTLDRLITFISGASRQVEAGEQRIARVFTTTRR